MLENINSSSSGENNSSEDIIPEQGWKISLISHNTNQIDSGCAECPVENNAKVNMNSVGKSAIMD